MIMPGRGPGLTRRRSVPRRLLPFLLGVLVLPPDRAAGQARDSVMGVKLTYAVGADLSFLKSAEDRGIRFKENGVTAK